MNEKMKYNLHTVVKYNLRNKIRIHFFYIHIILPNEKKFLKYYRWHYLSKYLPWNKKWLINLSVISDSDGVHKFKGKFIAICSFTMSCVCALTPSGASPYCHLGDGTTDLMLVQECSRFKYLKHLMRVADKTADQVI
jgi:hypothetical protein